MVEYRTTSRALAMAVVALPLDPGAQARALLHYILEQGDVVGADVRGRTIIQLAVDDWAFDQLLQFDGGREDLEDSGDREPDDQREPDEQPAVGG
jgi:hypothetical protein